jgi:hypothetical protein
MGDKQYTLGDLTSIVEQLHHLRQKYTWIGGQAVGVWASRYLTAEEGQQMARQLGLSFPLTSEDGDIRAKEEVATLLAHQFDAKLYAIRLKDPTRGKAWILQIGLPGQDEPFTLDVMENVPGLETIEGPQVQSFIYQLPIGPRSAKLVAYILDPISLLYAKADVWKREKDAIDPSTGLVKERNDDKHLMVLGAIIGRYLTEVERATKAQQKIPTTKEKEVERLEQFLTKFPVLPPGVIQNIRAALDPTDRDEGMGELSGPV